MRLLALEIQGFGAFRSPTRLMFDGPRSPWAFRANGYEFLRHFIQARIKNRMLLQTLRHRFHDE